MKNHKTTPVAPLPTRRLLLKAAGALPALGALPWLPRAQAAGTNSPLRIGYLPITDAAPLLIAHNNGLFEEQGLDVEKPRLFRSWAQITEAFLAGQVNAVHMLAPMTIWARYGSQARAKVVAWNHTGGSALTVLDSINTIDDLAGQTVAIPFWYSIHNIVLQQLLKSRGIEPIARGTPGPKQTQLVVMAPSDMVPALANKHIAGYIVAEPFNALAENRQIGKILRFTGDVWKDHACCVVMMNEDDLDQRPERVQKVVDSLVLAQLWIRDNPDQTAQILSKDHSQRYTPHSHDVLAKVLVSSEADTRQYTASGAIRHPEWREKRIDFQPFPYPTYTRDLVDLLKSTVLMGQNTFLDTLDPDFVADDLVDERFVRQAILSHGGPEAFGLEATLERTETIDSQS